ncbi:MAG: glycosylasparaginase [Ignavibacteria bacterium GWB2_35_12]|nr:MAG: glycosylasparaginase [Ignavibacteria bacterium GWB2_35_12]OGV20589.1 MAG: glycosylasparaginase [Ignavibacteria bacterium RIFOXYC2_FULL_35_21]
MIDRREFLKKTALVSIGSIAAFSKSASALIQEETADFGKSKQSEVLIPVVISTWKHGIPANEAAWKVIQSNGRALDAVEQGVRVPEADPNVKSVGYGGLPDRDGFVTLDACIMDENGNCGSVAYLQNIMHPISVARMVMEKTPHIMLAGKGALDFALANGFKKVNLLTKEAKGAWLKWKKDTKYNSRKSKGHDTIGMLAIDKTGNISGACTTSGLAWKYHGRVGDSPIIGAGMYVDNEVGGAAATGKGEAVIKMSGSFLIVELMRNGKSPQEACELAIQRIVKKQSDYKDFQVGFIALDKRGRFGAYSINKGFQFALYRNNQNQLLDSNSYLG